MQDETASKTQLWNSKIFSRNCLLICIALLQFCLFCCTNGRETTIPPVRAVNLGGWLVTEGWIKPSLYDGIPNGDLLDGTSVQFKSVTVGKYLSAELGGGSFIVADRPVASVWETFKLWRINETYFNFRVYNNQFVGLHTPDGAPIFMVATANRPSFTETFEIQRNPNDTSRVRIKTPHGFFLQLMNERLVTADYQGDTAWRDDDPSVFLLNVIGGLHGEYQLTNGHGPVVAPRIMKEHWSTYIVEQDFIFIKNNGLNAVRIPVGWWIASDPNPPRPYVAGSLQALDNAFLWAEKYKLKVIIDLHAAPGSQNGWEHSSSRDGSQEWGQTDANIQQTVDVISFLAARYARSPSLLAVELLNEPKSSGASLKILSKYYKLAYKAIRKHSRTVYVVLSNRLGATDPRELFPLAKTFSRSVVDVHYYLQPWDVPDALTVQQNLDYVYQNRSAHLKELTTSNGPLIFIGEWTAEWQIANATKKDYQRFAEAELQVYGKASFGWAYWTLKNNDKYKHWSLEWMISNGYISL